MQYILVKDRTSHKYLEVVVFIENKAICFDEWSWAGGASFVFKMNTPYTQGKITMMMY